MKRFKIIIISSPILLLFSILLALNSNAAKVEYETEPISFPISFPQQYGNELKSIEDTTLNLRLLSPNKLEKSINDEYIGAVLQKHVLNITDKSNKNGTRFNIKIIPLAVNKDQAVLNILENYLLDFVGIAPKNNQKEYIKNGFEVAAVGYNPFYEDGDNYFRIYTLLKKNDKAWMFTIGYLTDFSKSDSLDFSNSEDSKLFEIIMNSFTYINSKDEEIFNKLPKREISSDDLVEYHKFNSRFKTTI